jgi:hypothetical protein
VWAAPVVALVRALDPVIDRLPTRAMKPATAQLGVERIQDVRVQVTDLPFPERWRDVDPVISAIERQGVGCAIELIEVAGDQLVDRRVRPRVAAFADVAEQSGEGILRPGRRRC